MCHGVTQTTTLVAYLPTNNMQDSRHYRKTITNSTPAHLSPDLGLGYQLERTLRSDDSTEDGTIIVN